MQGSVVDEVTSTAVDVTVVLAWAAGAGLVAVGVGWVVTGLVVRATRHRPALRNAVLRTRAPLRTLLVVVAVAIALNAAAGPGERASWVPVVSHGLLIAVIAVLAWLAIAVLNVVAGRAVRRFEESQDRRDRRVRTQVAVLRRVLVAVVCLAAAAGVLFTFPAARVAGASIFASAGVISIVAGLAAQTSLGALFAGMQIAFTDAIRQGDVVVVDGEWGRIEEITLTYVVVRAWDDRRIIMPSTYFTTTPFENWTRHSTDLLGTVLIDVDFSVPIEAMRTELERVLASSPHWDGRTGILQVTDAVGGSVQVRALVSAADSGALFDLRVHVREALVTWLQRVDAGLPRTRVVGLGPFDPDNARPGVPAHGGERA